MKLLGLLFTNIKIIEMQIFLELLDLKEKTFIELQNFNQLLLKKSDLLW